MCVRTRVRLFSSSSVLDRTVCCVVVSRLAYCSARTVYTLGCDEAYPRPCLCLCLWPISCRRSQFSREISKLLRYYSAGLVCSALVSGNLRKMRDLSSLEEFPVRNLSSYR